MRKMFLVILFLSLRPGISNAITLQEVLNSIENNKEFYSKRSYRVVLHNLHLFTSPDESIINGKVDLKFIIIHKSGLLQVKEFEISDGKETLGKICLYYSKGCIDYRCKKRIITIHTPTNKRYQYPYFGDNESDWGISALDTIKFDDDFKRVSTITDGEREGRPCYIVETMSSPEKRDVLLEGINRDRKRWGTDEEKEEYLKIVTTPQKHARIWLDKSYGNLPVYAEINPPSSYYYFGKNPPLYYKAEFSNFSQIPGSSAWYCGKVHTIKYMRDSKDGSIKSTEQHITTSTLELDVDLKNEDFLFSCEPGDRVNNRIQNKVYAVGEDGKMDPPLEKLLEFK